MPVSWKSVQDVIAKAETGGIRLGVGAISPSGERFAHNGDRPFVAASTVKIAIMIEIFRLVDAGKLSLEKLHKMTADDKSNGSGVLLHMHTGVEVTIGDLVYLMMSISDNTATNILIDYAGMDQVNGAMRSLGMPKSVLGRKMRGRPVLPGENENLAVPSEYASMIQAIMNGTAASPSACTQMVSVLEKQQNNRRIARHLPRDNTPRWGTKTGSLPNVINDVGFIMTPKGPAIAAVFVENCPDQLAGEQIIGDVARAVLSVAA